MRTLSITLALLAAPVAAQLKVSVQATNDAGVALDRATGNRAVQNHPANQPFTKFSRAYIREQNPYASLMSYAYPPFTWPTGQSFNRVTLATSVYARKNSGHKSMHTTGDKAGAPGANKFRITLTSTKAIQVKADWGVYGNIYAASSAKLRFTVGSTTKNYSWSSGFNRDSGSLQIPVNGTVNVDVEIEGRCQPGAPGGNAYADGFNASVWFNFLETGNGSFKTFGTGCAKGKIGAKSTPTRGSTFTLDLTGEDPNVSCALLWGHSKEYHQFFKLPLDLSYMSPGCFLNVSFTFPWYRSTDSAGNASASVFIPYWASGTLYGQWLIWDPKNPSKPPKLTKGAEIKY